MRQKWQVQSEQARAEQRAFDALVGRETARQRGRTPDGYAGILEEWIVQHREFPTWQDAMVWRMDQAEVERFLTRTIAMRDVPCEVRRGMP